MAENLLFSQNKPLPPILVRNDTLNVISDTIPFSDIFDYPAEEGIKDNLYQKGLHTDINRTYAGYDIVSRNIPLDLGVQTKYYGAFTYYKNFGTDTSKKKTYNLLKIYPIKDLMYGYSGKTKEGIHDMSVGVLIKASYKNKLSAFWQTQYHDVKLPYYMDSLVRQTGVMPGQGRAFPTAQYTWYYYYHHGGIKYSPNKVFHFQGGLGKVFLGDGIRSLLLSDNASPYPYFMVTTRIWKFNYVNLYSNLHDIRGMEQERFKFVNKYSATHYLSWDVAKWFSFSIFETIIFQNRSQAGNLIFFEPNYLNPVIFFRPVEYSVGSPDNSLLGTNIKFKYNRKNYIYLQAIIDEFLLREIRERRGWKENKQGFQAGFRSFDLFGVKQLNFVAEYNWVRPYTYFHRNVFQNHGHMNQPMAHPLGANFAEFIAKADYKPAKKWLINVAFMSANVGLDYADSLGRVFSYGQNIYGPDILRPNEFGNFTGQGVNTNIKIADINVSYMFGQSNNFCIHLGLMNRWFSNSFTKYSEPIYTFGLKTFLQRREKYF